MSRSSLLFLALAACSTTFNGGTDPEAVPDETAETADTAPVSLRLRMDAPMQRLDGADPAPEGCLDEADGGTRGDAVATGIAVKVRSLTLLGADDTKDVELLAETAYDDAAWIELGEDGVEVEAAEIPLGTYDGVSLGVWAMRAELPMSLSGVEGSEHEFTMWFAERDFVMPRDVTVSVDDVDHWVDLETGALVAVPKELEDVDAADTGFEEDKYGYSPSERLRLRDDPSFWDEDPVVMSSDDGDLPFETEEGDTTVTLAEGVELAEGIEVDVTVLELTFLPIDSMSWWEGPVAKPEVDGVYNPLEDCGLDVRMPGVLATATVGGEMPELPEDEGDTGATDTADPEG
jgi:hypothetical protein